MMKTTLRSAITEYLAANRHVRTGGYAQESYAEWFYYDAQHRVMTEDGDRSRLARFGMWCSAPFRFALQRVLPVPPTVILCSLFDHRFREELLSAEDGHSELYCTRCGCSHDIWM
jgi:hypothetical protein